MNDILPTDGLSQADLNHMLNVLRLTAKHEMSGDVYWQNAGDKISFYFMCSDVFHYASADLERITPENFQVLEECIRDLEAIGNGFAFVYADLLYCARVRRMRPLATRKKFDKPEIQALFDACGPER